MADTQKTSGSTAPGAERPATLREWARTLAPHLDVVSASVPEPVLQPGDTVAIFRDADAARELVLAWERIEPADNSVGLVALGAAPDRPAEIERPTGADPEGVSGHAARRIVKGAIPGMFVGAAVVGTTVAATVGGTGAVAGGAFGGAALGAVAGATMAIVTGTGWGEAYQHSFVDPDATDVVVASFHSTDADRGRAAADAASGAGARLARVGQDGSVTAY